MTSLNIWPVVTFRAFDSAMRGARILSAQVCAATSEPSHVPGTIYVLSTDRLSGYAVRPDGELVLVFSLARGRGDFIVAAAIADSATYLDCFDGYLPTLYARHGFEPVGDPVKNWTPGQPDVILMSLPGYADRHGV